MSTWLTFNLSLSLSLGCVCFLTQVVLNRNLSVLQETIKQLHLTEANLTAQILLQEGNVPSVGKTLSEP